MSKLHHRVIKVYQVSKAADEAIRLGKYLKVRDQWNNVYGFNPRVAALIKDCNRESNDLSWVKGFWFVDFHEYIRVKTPFVSKLNGYKLRFL